MTIRLGCAVWAHKPWIGTFYPAGTPQAALLRRYSERTDTVEGNATFYAVPSAATVAKWCAETPPTFRFCCKIPKAISHAPTLHTTTAARDAFLERMAPLGERQGPFFLQLPPRYSSQHLVDLSTWLASWPTSLRIAVEVRHPSWYTPRGRDALQNLLDRGHIGHCIMDVRPLDEPDLPGADADLDLARDHKPNVPLDPWVSGSLALVRYISHPDTPTNVRYLAEWAHRIAHWEAQGIDTYFFMHCPNEDRSPAHLHLLRSELAKVLPTHASLWDNSPPETQTSLF
jgi:uncharacterized protein YecE (DUF72 family)